MLTINLNVSRSYFDPTKLFSDTSDVSSKIFRYFNNHSFYVYIYYIQDQKILESHQGLITTHQKELKATSLLLWLI